MFELEWSSGKIERFDTEQEAYERFINASAWDGGSLFPIRVVKRGKQSNRGAKRRPKRTK